MNKKNPNTPPYDYRGLPPDLWPRVVKVGKPGDPLGQRGFPEEPDRTMARGYLGNAIYISRTFQGRVVTVGTTPTQIISAGYSNAYILLNPSESIGLTTYGTHYSGTETGNGNSQATPLGVANYKNLHLWLYITAITGTWTFYAQAKDPTSGTWADVQALFVGVTATGTSYAYVADLGIGTDFAIRWTEDVAGSITFQMNYALKDGVGGDSSGVSQTVYLGSTDGVTTISGFPLLEGNSIPLVLGENVDIWGVAEASVGIRVFDL